VGRGILATLMRDAPHDTALRRRALVLLGLGALRAGDAGEAARRCAEARRRPDAAAAARLTAVCVCAVAACAGGCVGSALQRQVLPAVDDDSA
jgi:hypothetical protein